MVFSVHVGMSFSGCTTQVGLRTPFFLLRVFLNNRPIQKRSAIGRIVAFNDRQGPLPLRNGA
jgi:hypothetical protein